MKRTKVLTTAGAAAFLAVILLFSGMRIQASAAENTEAAGETQEQTTSSDPSDIDIPIGINDPVPEGGGQIFTLAGKWVKDSKGWWYRNPDGSYPRNTWKKIDGTWYHFDSSGYMQTGWQKIGGKWYYLGGNGMMRTGWQQIGGKWYYFDGNGAMCTGWRQIGGKWYYFTASGNMWTGWAQIGGKWYYMNGSGEMLTGWQKISGKWYYFTASGNMWTGWAQIGGKWYYMNSSGVMQTGWQQLGGKWYYFGSDGRMRCDEFDDDHRHFLNENGVWSDLGIDLYQRTVSQVIIGSHMDPEGRHEYRTASPQTRDTVVSILSEAQANEHGRLRLKLPSDYFYFTVELRYTDQTSETVWVFPHLEGDLYQIFYCEGSDYFDYSKGRSAEYLEINSGIVDRLQEACFD